MEPVDIVLICNVLVSIGLFLATLYRIKIEREQVKTIIRNAKSAEKLETIKKVVQKERSEICKMNGGELMEFLEQVFKDED